MPLQDVKGINNLAVCSTEMNQTVMCLVPFAWQTNGKCTLSSLQYNLPSFCQIIWKVYIRKNIRYVSCESQSVLKWHKGPCPLPIEKLCWIAWRRYCLDILIASKTESQRYIFLKKHLFLLLQDLLQLQLPKYIQFHVYSLWESFYV